MSILRYCKWCWYPNTKPRLTFNGDGICSACTAYETRPEIDWDARQAQFVDLSHAAMMEARPYDCVVPVSGGKDSTYQVLKCIEYGLKPLAVTAMTDHLTPLGQKNLDNISRLGVDHIMVQVNQQLRRKINRYTLENLGDISWPEHVLIFTVPVREAVLRRIPLIVYGENPENEYGGPFESQGTHEMTPAWLQEFGGLLGFRVSDLEEQGLAYPRDLTQYEYPDLESFTPKAVFLGYYFQWDGMANATAAFAKGFRPWTGRVPGALLSYENLDNAQTGIHDRFKYLKYGFGRATDHACNLIRRERISRELARRMIMDYDGEPPENYLGVPLGDVLTAIGMTRREYISCERRFANPDLFDTSSPMKFPKAKFELE